MTRRIKKMENDLHECQVSTPKMTCLVVTDNNNIVVEATPIIRWSIGVPFIVLVKWLAKQGTVEIRPLTLKSGLIR